MFGVGVALPELELLSGWEEVDVVFCRLERDGMDHVPALGLICGSAPVVIWSSTAITGRGWDPSSYNKNYESY